MLNQKLLTTLKMLLLFSWFNSIFFPDNLFAMGGQIYHMFRVFELMELFFPGSSFQT